MNTVQKAEEISNDAFSFAGYKEKPAGKQWVMLVLNIARQYARDGMHFTDSDLEQLTTDNYHTARFAAEIVRDLQATEAAQAIFPRKDYPFRCSKGACKYEDDNRNCTIDGKPCETFLTGTGVSDCRQRKVACSNCIIYGSCTEL